MVVVITLLPTKSSILLLQQQTDLKTRNVEARNEEDNGLASQPLNIANLSQFIT